MKPLLSQQKKGAEGGLASQLPPAEAVTNQIPAPSAAQAIASHYKSGGEFGAFFYST